MTGLLGIILIIVGIVHIDDASAGHQRLALPMQPCRCTLDRSDD
jgi:hypothetical protein